jgi:hypothetical protein
MSDENDHSDTHGAEAWDSRSWHLGQYFERALVTYNTEPITTHFPWSFTHLIDNDHLANAYLVFCEFKKAYYFSVCILSATAWNRIFFYPLFADYQGR